ncbi:MAG: histone deacetylase [Humidesulfovibrio sp.]|uniref:histone deacetylase family protein n=1 Tax=Humidesulfovibrio sp. TaxID=2910988 RepID=UPI0027356080|nr:histone deacetylase [Humidesulfovibrio sp.]MDP2848431.1 histone deacetylase [Humidesulfovibrio sp.]
MHEAKHSLGVILFPAFDWSISPTHPEREERLLYTQDQLKEEGLFDIEGVDEYKPGVASREDVERTHFCFPELEAVATRSHMVAAGGCITAADLVMQGRAKKAFALVRPPGHHAMKVVQGSRGFCNINIEAVMIEHLRENHGKRRIAVVDTDCHHGDGTQDIYWHDPDVLFISLHQDGRTLYPGTGFPTDCGGPKALGRTINIPLPPGTSDEGYMMAMERVVMPILKDFQPEVVINSAGQDNHFTDPITNMNLTAQGYAKLTELLQADLAVLEGGYSIQGALPYVNLGICLSMAGLDYSGVREPGFDAVRHSQRPQIAEYLAKMCDTLPELYFNPPALSEAMQGGVIEDGWFVRHKDIYYDTDGISEAQTESLLMCDSCRGLLKVVSRSTKNPDCLGVEIPVDACPRCREMGLAHYDEAQAKDGYRYTQLINRVDRQYLRHGF